MLSVYPLNNKLVLEIINHCCCLLFLNKVVLKRSPCLSRSVLLTLQMTGNIKYIAQQRD